MFSHNPMNLKFIPVSIFESIQASQFSDFKTNSWVTQSVVTEYKWGKPNTDSVGQQMLLTNLQINEHIFCFDFTKLIYS